MRLSRLLVPTALLALAGAIPLADLLFARQANPPARPARKVALLVGPSTYLHDFDKLNYAAADVEALATLLRENGFDEVVVLTDSPEGKNPATRKNVVDRLEQMVSKQANPANNIRKGDVVLVVLSGHGLELDVPDPDKPGQKRREAFFAPVDGKKGKPDTLIGLGYLVNDMLAPCGGRNFLLVDACREIYDPNKGRGIGGKSVSLNGESAVLFSCSSAEKSWESDTVKHGVFTHAILEVAAETRIAGKPLTWSGLVSRVEEKMGEDMVKKLIPAGETQTPVLAAGQVPATELFAAKARVPKKDSDLGSTGGETARDLATGEKVQEFEYVIEGEKKKGTCRVLTVDIGGGEKMEFVRIRKGNFSMGSPKEEKNRGDDEDQHEVEITKDYYLGKFAVTQAQYKAVVGENPSHFKGDRLPVETVSWEDAKAYCEKLSKKLNRKVLLPSEAQWEYACRGGTKTPFHFGSRLNGDLANCDGNLPYGTGTKGPNKAKTVEVGSYPANPWGLHDMHGNVWQWCQDYYGAYEKLDSTRDPIQLTKQSDNYRVLRGGSWSSVAWNCRSANRHRSEPVNRNDYGGFRVCLPLEK